MSEQQAQTEKLASSTLKLRSALSVALLALSDIETLDSHEEMRARARTARLAARAILSKSATTLD